MMFLPENCPMKMFMNSWLGDKGAGREASPLLSPPAAVTMSGRRSPRFVTLVSRTPPPPTIEWKETQYGMKNGFSLVLRLTMNFKWCKKMNADPNRITTRSVCLSVRPGALCYSCVKKHWFRVSILSPKDKYHQISPDSQSFLYNYVEPVNRFILNLVWMSRHSF